MSEEILCYRCGTSLAALSLPISRRDTCPGCGVHVHVCRMCTSYDSSVPGQCREEDAEEVFEKEKVNFCEWFDPAAGVFDADRANEASRASQDLAALFGDEPDSKPDTNALTQKAEDLFK